MPLRSPPASARDTREDSASPPLRAAQSNSQRCKKASEHYSDLGWSVGDVSLSESYDLRCTRQGEELHVEVKGTTSQGERVLLTRNEVAHAREWYPGVAR